MKRIFAATAIMLLATATAHAAGIDETINTATAPIAAWVGKFVFFKIPIFGASCRWSCCGWSPAPYSLLSI